MNRLTALAAGRVEHVDASRAELPYRNVAIEYLFRSWAEAGDAGRAAELGFTHLIAYTKRDPAIARRLERRVVQQYPTRYERCVRGLDPIPTD